ncbi:MAG TPA: GtrA family protein [Novosphingobium sp.]|nr:GtrA family protein [Novosphingobium sp.]
MTKYSSASVARVWRYYKVGVINTLFGYGIYALLVSVGLKMYVAQIVGHIIGVVFNYFSYSRHVFQDAPASKLRFLLSYAFNYFVSLASLALAATIFSSPYVAGLLAMLIASIINFLVLRRYVFPSGPYETQDGQPATVSEKVDHASCR